MRLQANGEAKADILKENWQDRACKCADDEKHVPLGAWFYRAEEQSNSSNELWSIM